RPLAGGGGAAAMAASTPWSVAPRRFHLVRGGEQFADRRDRSLDARGGLCANRGVERWGAGAGPHLRESLGRAAARRRRGSSAGRAAVALWRTRRFHRAGDHREPAD